MNLKTTSLIGIFCLILTACEPKPDYVLAGPKVSGQDFAVIVGDWPGTLTYTDYSSGESTSIPTRANVTLLSDSEIAYTVSYPDEPWEDTKSTIKVSSDGRLLDSHVIVNRSVDKQGTLIVTTEHRGEDDNLPADIRQSYGMSATYFYISKEVKFDHSPDYMLRNTYVFTRSKM